ncbi:hypothetical protein AAI_07130, partial [Pseudomonas viridiflava UASWS0038]
GTISVISSTPIMLMLVLSVIPESCRLPRGMHSVSHFRFCPCFARLADLFITMSAEHEHDQCPGSLMYNEERWLTDQPIKKPRTRRGSLWVSLEG